MEQEWLNSTVISLAHQVIQYNPQEARKILEEHGFKIVNTTNGPQLLFPNGTAFPTITFIDYGASRIHLVWVWLLVNNGSRI
jgi:hypothetical protein